MIPVPPSPPADEAPLPEAGGPGGDGAAQDAAEPALPTSTLRRRRGVILFTIGGLLLGAALWTVLRNTELLQTAWQSARQAPWWLVLAFVLLPMVNWLLSSILFFVLTRRYGQVGLGEMTALIGSAWLLNNLPMRPGMIGRIAYHRAVNKIRVADSVRVLVLSGFCTACGFIGALTAAMVPPMLGSGLPLGLAATIVLLMFTAAAAGMWIRHGRAGAGDNRRGDLAWRIALGALIRYIDVLLWGLRYWLAFTLVGVPIGPEGALVIAAASQAAMLVPIQFGVREWIVGVAASALPPGLWARGEAPTGVFGAGVAPGLMADLLNRAAELAVALPVGVLSTAWLASRRRALRTG